MGVHRKLALPIILQRTPSFTPGLKFDVNAASVSATQTPPSLTFLARSGKSSPLSVAGWRDRGTNNVPVIRRTPASVVEDQVYIILDPATSPCGCIDVIPAHFPDECLRSDAHAASHNRSGQHISGLSTRHWAILKSENLFINMFFSVNYISMRSGSPSGVESLLLVK